MPIWNNILEVAIEHRINFQGDYNGNVLHCPNCTPNVDLGVKTTIGLKLQ